MAHLVRFALERATENNGATLVLYYDAEPTQEEVVAAADSLCGKLPLSADTTDPFFCFREHQTPVSVRAGLRRYEVYPTG